MMIIGKLNKIEKDILTRHLEESYWKPIREKYDHNEWGKECTCKFYKNSNKVRSDLCNHCCGVIDNIFQKIGWMNNNYLILCFKEFLYE